MSIVIRTMKKGDIDAVHEIETLSFRTPWTKAALRSELTNTVAHYLVLVEDGCVLGYCGMWVMFDEAHVTNLAIHPHIRGRGLSKALLFRSMEWAEELGANAMTLEVRETNHIAQRLYEGFGFVQQGLRKGYYEDTGENALLLWNRDIEDTLAVRDEQT